MMKTEAQNRSAADESSSPFYQAGIVQKILDYVGPGHWLFISTVSKLYRDLYKKVKSQHVVSRGRKGVADSNMTLFSSVCASPSRLRLAHSRGYGCLVNKSLREYYIGWVADKPTLMTAHELGLVKYSSDVLTGAVRAGDLTKAIWLHTEQHCELDHDNVCSEAAMGVSIAVLDWLKQSGVAPDSEACNEAAFCGHMDVLQYLHAEGCQLESEVCYSAVYNDDFVMLKWAHEHGAAQDYAQEDMCDRAAKSHCIEMMAWLIQQPGVELAAYLMSSAAESGDKAMCELLHANQCPWDEFSCDKAARAGISKHDNFELLRWFRQHGCPWDTDKLAKTAASGNSVELLEYLQQEDVVFTAEQLTHLLNIAGVEGSLEVAKWLREQGAEWPAVLTVTASEYHKTKQWSGDTLAWARAERCVSPLE
jgi:hypothetical protein